MNNKFTPQEKKVIQALERFRPTPSPRFHKKMENAPWMAESKKGRFGFQIRALEAFVAAALFVVILFSGSVMYYKLPRIQELVVDVISPIIEEVGTLNSTDLPIATLQNLDDDVASWAIYEQGKPTWILNNVDNPSIDGVSLRCSLVGGRESYSNVHCYNNLDSKPLATSFRLDLSFYYSPTTKFNSQTLPNRVQALEFSMSKWQNEQRYELALQWRNIGTNANHWHYWDGSKQDTDRWVPLNITETLTAGEWHSLTIIGEIVDGQVHYESFTIDRVPHDLDITVPPASAQGWPNRLAVAVQLDGNARSDPYDLFIDKVNFTYQ